jgi:cytochrome P450
MSRPYPPGPRDRLFGITLHKPFSDNPLAFTVKMAREYGDFCFARIGWVRFYLVNRPDLVREVLATKVKSFRKLGRQMRSLRKIEGDGLVASEGETWARHRPLVQGSFHNRHFGGYGDVVVEATRRRLDQWPARGGLDLADEMNELALQIIARIVFDLDVAGDAGRFRDAVHAFRTAMQREISRPVMLPDWLPLAGKMRQRRAVAVVNELIWQQIRERRAHPGAKNDMLAQMLRAASSAPQRITDEEIRDEAATLFVAGHDTTSAALAWFWYCLTSHPDVERRVRHELADVLGDRPATAADFARLRYLDQVVKESMRLYPAAGFLFGREAVEDVALDGHVLRRGAWVFIAPYIIQRDPRNFPDPLTFDPERFAPGRVDAIPPYAYIPFGAGPRTCIGNSLATVQIVLMAATILQRYRVILDQDEPEPEMEIVLRPRGGLRVRVEAVGGAGGVRRAA